MIESPPDPVLKIRWPEFDRVTTLRGWTTDAERARQIGISDRMLSSMRKGRVRPGPKVIDGIIRAFGHQMYDVLFERVNRDAA